MLGKKRSPRMSTERQEEPNPAAAGYWETMAAVEQSLVEMVRFDLPTIISRSIPMRVLQLKIDDLDRAARKVIHPDSVVWVVVGDRAGSSPDPRARLGEVFVVDSEASRK